MSGRVKNLAKQFDSLQVVSSPERSPASPRKRKVAVPAAKSKVSRRRSSRRSSSQHEIRSKASNSVPKSKSVTEKLCTFPEKPALPPKKPLKCSSPIPGRAKGKPPPPPKPRAPPKPSRLTPAKSTTSDDYAAYDSDFSTHRDSSGTEIELPELDLSGGEMKLSGDDLELSGNIYQPVLGAISPPQSGQSDSKPKSTIHVCAESPPPLPPRNSALLQRPPSAQAKSPEKAKTPEVQIEVESYAGEDSGEYEDIDDDLADLPQMNRQASLSIAEGSSMISGSSGSWETSSTHSTVSAERPKLVAFRQMSEDRAALDQCSYQTIDSPTKDKAALSSTFTAPRRKKLPNLPKFRPISQPSLDGLLRIKSDIRVNLKKQVGKIKLRVTHGAEGVSKKQGRLPKAEFYAHPESLSNPATPSEAMVASIQFPLNDDHLYDDDWSDSDHWSDEEEDEEPQPTVSSAPPTASTPAPVPSLLEDVISTLSLSTSPTQEDDAATLRGSYHQDQQQQPLRYSSDLPSPCATVTESTTTSSEEQHQDDGTSSGDMQPHYTSKFGDNQPLYQHYMLDRIARIERNSSISSTRTGMDSLTSNGTINRERLTAASAMGSQRSLWCELPEVVESGLLETLSRSDQKLQEAMFEVITSEASYVRSLNVLITHFMAAPELSGNKATTANVIDKRDRKHLFSNILAVRDCGERLLSGLETLLEDDLVLNDVVDILSEHFETHFEPYVKYCSNQTYQDRTLRKLKSENEVFSSVLVRLEGNRECQGLDMRSFLTLPTQRITRYPLLIVAILERTDQGNCAKYDAARRALTQANQLVSRCNEGARRMDRMEHLVQIDSKLRYKSTELKRLALVSSNRHLVKQGELIQLVKPEGPATLRKGSLALATITAQTRRKNKKLYLFLFNDMLIVTKKKSSGFYSVKDYCLRAFVEVSPLEPSCPQVAPAALSSLPAHLSRKPHLFLVTLMQNARGKQQQLVLCSDSETDRERWLSAMRPPAASNPEEKIYADWDCPQVQAVNEYIPTQEDELRLAPGDVINVRRKMKDGWLEGERLDQSASGWFPSSYVSEILNDHVRAKHYRQRLQFLTALEERQHQDQANNTCHKSPVQARDGAKGIKGRFKRITHHTSGIFQL